MVVSSATIDSLLKEREQYPPPEAFRKQALVKDDSIYEDSERDFEGFWAKEAEGLRWIKKWDKVLQWDLPFAKWFVGGKINVSENCLDRHVHSERRNKAAIVWEGEPG
ncbi:MAG TPA: acetyl-coenzyme A synthetase N-terminal domain-containing protein, partial [Thermoplasmata archaeon]